jgi:chromatin remodeling complex protein RSC6
MCSECQLEGLFFLKHITNADTYTRTSTHLYEYIHAHPISMSTSKKLSRLDIEIHEVGHQECIIVDGDVGSY